VAAALAAQPSPTPTALPTETPTQTPVPLAPGEPEAGPSGAGAAGSAAEGPRPTSTSVLADLGITPPPEVMTAAAERVAVLPMTPSPSDAIDEPRTPVDMGALVRSSLPPVFVGLGVVALAVLVGAAIAILRGPRDI
jgi:hypothetical protein